ncbi:hypothetical protein KW798_00770 [Candidatus Parcubacteria bacterium]|nr:hypothetical protein [Candidatus Parcubacteria bacterium]
MDSDLERRVSVLEHRTDNIIFNSLDAVLEELRSLNARLNQFGRSFLGFQEWMRQIDQEINRLPSMAKQIDRTELEVTKVLAGVQTLVKAFEDELQRRGVPPTQPES